MWDPHPDADAEIPRQELDFAYESAFLQYRSVRRAASGAGLRDRVAYQDPAGDIHMLFVVEDADERTLLIRGFRNGEEEPVSIRVMRGEVERLEDIARIASGILAKTYPCAQCSAAELPRITGRTGKPMSH